MTEESIPQWKRDLIERRRALGRAASVGPLQFTCPGVVSALRQPELSAGMRLPSAFNDIQHLLIQIEAEQKTKMGEEKTKKVSAAGHDGKSPDEGNLSDSSEEFKYGPGIVSKLKSRYLSLTLRETVKTRPSLASLRRATSLENILDEPEKPEELKIPKFVKNVGIGSANQSRRGLSRNKENMKRARSVEALMRYNRNVDCQKPVDPPIGAVEGDRPRNRLSLEEKELPPPDLVKQTLRLFEREGTPKVSPPSLKCSSLPKPKPPISPKPGSIEKPQWDLKSPKVLNGHDDHLESKQRLKCMGDVTLESPRAVKDIIKIPASVEIIERAKNEDKPPVVMKKEVIVVKNDEVDACNTRAVPKERSPQKSDTVPPNQEKSIVGDQIRSPIPLDKPLVCVMRKVSNDGSSQPSPKPRSLPKATERRQMDVPPPAPPIPFVEPVLQKSPEPLSSPGAQMKQVGVIRPIVTHKTHSPPAPKFQKSHNDRELEKNLLNKVRSVEQPVTKVIVSLKKSPEECTVSPPKPIDESKPIPAPTWGPKPNSMVFNFSHRKEVPDYIENDGLILTSKKDKPRPGEPGIVLLPDGTVDSSVDFEPEEVHGPPSPCQLVIVGGNVLINGKSSLQKGPKRKKLRIKFNDEATTFEYPSETSMMEDLPLDSSQPTTSSSPLNVPLRSGSLASYTPSQLAMGSDFQLGVTRSQPPPQLATTKLESSDEDDYLRPADDASTVAWSAETAADLLF